MNLYIDQILFVFIQIVVSAMISKRQLKKLGKSQLTLPAKATENIHP